MQGIGLLILFFHIAVFSAAPLSHVHVENEGGISITMGHEPGEAAEPFLSLLHEILFLHLSGRADYALSVPETRIHKSQFEAHDGVTAPEHAFSGSVIHSPPAICWLPCSTHTGRTQQPSPGYRIFISGLSPPSV